MSGMPGARGRYCFLKYRESCMKSREICFSIIGTAYLVLTELFLSRQDNYGVRIKIKRITVCEKVSQGVPEKKTEICF